MKVVRLTTGDEVICNVVETENSIKISDAFSMVATEPGKIGFIPFMAYAKDEEFVISKEFVVMVCDPVDELVDQIRSMTSGIITPPKQGIIV
jgi:hypothetical protein|tara:strand:- start:19 stop:294 length:276 start_codon:yes stop_codon:yes gene_type:complete